MAKKEDFFIEEIYVPDEDYAHMERYIRFLDAFSRTTYISIYVIDYFRKNFLYVSENPLFLCGMSAEKVRDMGYDFYLEHVTDADLPLLLEVNRAGFLFSKSVPPPNLLEYSLGYDFHMKQPSGKAMLVHHEITPLHLTRDGRIWLALCSVSLPTQTKAGDIRISRQGCNSRWRYHPENKKWTRYAGMELKEYEKEVLRLSAQGCTMNEISEQIHKSVDTIKGYKRLLFEKFNVANINEAIGFAINHKLI